MRGALGIRHSSFAIDSDVGFCHSAFVHASCFPIFPPLVISPKAVTMPAHVSPQLNESRMESRPVSRFAGQRVHFIGIGGCGMSGLARMLLDAGAIITGSEPNPNPQTFDLVGRGANVSRDQLGELLVPRPDLVVRTAAVKDW